jgi:murein DD-endopeptidase MepM/ murein hydrolase activator NlpD
MSNHYAGGLGLYLQGNETGTVYYYAHLDSFAGGIGASVSVGKGQLLGWVGVTGNATAPNLHFGLMPRGLDLSTLQNPFPLLAELCQ